MNKPFVYGLSTCAVVCALVSGLSAAAQTYSPGVTWHRSSDWIEGTLPGSTLGNAAVDSYGSPVWRYGSLTGGSLTSTDPWFENASTLMVWDDAWWGGGVGGVWARGYNGPGADNVGANPPIDRNRMFHDLSAKTLSSEYVPTIDWVNPAGNGAIVNIGGEFRFNWEGHFADGSPAAPVEAVIAKFDASAGKYEVIWSGEASNPTAGGGLSADSKVAIPLAFSGLRFDEGDSLRFSFRGLSETSEVPLWVGAQDAFFMRLVAVVPEPSEYILLAGGLALLVFVRSVSAQRVGHRRVGRD